MVKSRRSMSEAFHSAFQPWRQRVLRHRTWLLLGLTILCVLGVRLRLREMPLERDEGQYAYAGQLLLQGDTPYGDVYTTEFPGTYAAYALIMAVLGQSASGIHVGLALVNLACILMVFQLGRKLLDDATAVAGAVAFALLSLSPSVQGLAAHATHFVILAALGGTVVLLKSLVSSQWSVASTGASTAPATDRGPRTTDYEPSHSPPPPFAPRSSLLVASSRGCSSGWPS